jgi:hypothetical protein
MTPILAALSGAKGAAFLQPGHAWFTPSLAKPYSVFHQQSLQIRCARMRPFLIKHAAGIRPSLFIISLLHIQQFTLSSLLPLAIAFLLVLRDFFVCIDLVLDLDLDLDLDLVLVLDLDLIFVIARALGCIYTFIIIL